MTKPATAPAPTTTIAAVASPDAVLFDLDGTLIDSRRSFTGSINHTLRLHGESPRTEAELDRFLGPPTSVTFRELLGDDDQVIAGAVATYREHQLAHGTAEVAAFDGVRTLLASLRGRVKVALATSKQIMMAELLLDKLELREYFDVVCGSLPGSLAETKAETVARALRTLGSPPRAVMIGDRRFDVEGANANGLPTIGVIWGAATEATRTAAAAEMHAAGAIAVVSRPAEIPPLLGL